MSLRTWSNRLAAVGLGLIAGLGQFAAPAFAQLGGMNIHQGNCFAYAIPPGWKANDTTNGVDLLSPDGSEYVYFSVLERMPGRQTPEGYLMMLGKTINVDRITIVSDEQGPAVPYFPKTRLIYFESSAHGVAYRSHCICAVNNGLGQWAAYCQGYSARADIYNNVSPFLETVARSITPTGGARIAGSNTIMHGVNHPNTAGDTIMQSWQYKNQVNDRLSQNRQDMMRGVSRQMDPATGTIYDMPQGSYNASRGGYVNPYRPDEILKPVVP